MPTKVKQETNIRSIHTNLPKQKELSLQLFAQKTFPDAKYRQASSKLLMLMPLIYTLYCQLSQPWGADNKGPNQMK